MPAARNDWDQTAVIGHEPEDRQHVRGTPGIAPCIAATARIEAYVTIDAGTVRATYIGLNTWLMKKVHVGHDALIHQYCELAPMVNVGGWAVIEEGAKIGMSAVILPYRRVGRRAVVGAGAVVTRDVPPGVTVVGNPARPLRDDERDSRPFSKR